MVVGSRKILKKLAISTGTILTLVTLPIQAAQATKVIWTVYEISFKLPHNPGEPPPDYPGAGSR